MTQPSPLIGTLVRFWENGFRNNITTVWVDWNSGYFHQYLDSPLARMLNDAAVGKRDLLLTVYSTEELLWTVSSTHHIDIYGKPFLTVHCVPWREQLRHGLISDDYLTWLWLDAEKRHEAVS